MFSISDSVAIFDVDVNDPGTLRYEIAIVSYPTRHSDDREGQFVRDETRSPAPTSGPDDAGLSAEKPTVTSRVIKLLEVIGQREGGVGVREAARDTGIDRSAVSRMLRQLEGLGWVQAADDRGNYTAGPEFYAIAASVRQRDSLWQAAAPLLETVTSRFNETTYLAVRRDHQVIFRDKVDCTQPIRYLLELNQAFPLTTGAAGRAILSALPEEEVNEVLAAGLTAYTEHSITDPGEYRAQLARDQDLGYSYSQSGWVAGGAGVASAYRDAAGTCIGAITVSAPIDRLTPDRVLTIGPIVREAAAALSRRLGLSP